jgi:hypothetical protein
MTYRNTLKHILFVALVCSCYCSIYADECVETNLQLIPDELPYQNTSSESPCEPPVGSENTCIVELCADSVWFPESPPIFRPFIANPRQVTYSAGWRFDDKLFDHNCINVSFGDTFAIYQWNNVYGGPLRIELEGAVWALFAPLQESSPLINADYYVGVPITYAHDNWSFRLRGYHISSHIGDEFLLMHQKFKRLNPSAEYIDFFASYNFKDELRLFAGLGWMVHQDESFKLHPFFAAAGWEWRMNAYKYYNASNNLYGVPFFASYFHFSKDCHHGVDQNYALGYEWGKLVGLCRRLRIFVEYHNGNSVEGQFSKFNTEYYGIRATYGF